MIKQYLIIAYFIFTGSVAFAQNTQTDSIPPVDDGLAIDTSLDYDDLLNDLDLFLDSILAPRSYLLANLSVGQRYFSFTVRGSNRLRQVQKFLFSPTIGYYSKSGLGFTVSGNIIRDSQQLNLYQLTLSPSYDYLENRDLATGIAYLRYFTKDKLRFYTSPLKNEISGYFLWRKSWLQPGIAANFGWGSSIEYKKWLAYIQRYDVFIPVITTTKESVKDFVLTASLRHDFYWLNVFSDKDYIKLTPQLAFSGGTQRYGSNQTTGTYGAVRPNVTFTSGNTNLEEELKFQPLSLTFYLRPEYSIGKFFLQPQFLVDYYFPAKDNNLSTFFSINAGFTF